MVEPGRYGEPGPRVRTSPFLFGLLATAGGLLAIVALFGIARVGTVLVMLVAATYFAIGLDRPVQLLVRRGLSRVNFCRGNSPIKRFALLSTQAELGSRLFRAASFRLTTQNIF